MRARLQGRTLTDLRLRRGVVQEAEAAAPVCWRPLSGQEAGYERYEVRPGLEDHHYANASVRFEWRHLTRYMFDA
jgi:hypothetical protein